jgi:hypothetical protein
VIQLPIVHSGFVACFQYEGPSIPGKTASERTEPLPCPVGEAHIRKAHYKEGLGPSAPYDLAVRQLPDINIKGSIPVRGFRT